MEPDKTTLKLQVQLLKDMASRRQQDDGGVRQLVSSWVATWTEMSSLAVTLIQANRRMQSIEDYEGFWKKDDDGALLKAIINTRLKIRKLEQNSLRLLEKSGLQEDSETVLGRMFSTHMPPALTTELKNESFDDAVGWRAATLVQGLEATESKFRRDLCNCYKKSQPGVEEDDLCDYLEKYADGGWCTDATNEDDLNFEDLHELAGKTIFVHLPGVSMVNFCERVKSVAWTAVSLLCVAM